MFTRQHNLGWEIAWWIALLTLAGWLMALLAGPIYGAPPKSAPNGAAERAAMPKLLDELHVAWAEAVADFRAGAPDIARDQLMSALDSAGFTRRPVGGDAALDMWIVLFDHVGRDDDRAIEGWQFVTLAPGRETWRHLAIAAMHLDRGNLAAADEAILQARDADPLNPVMHYYAGRVRIAESLGALDWTDGRAEGPVQRVAYRPAPLSLSAGMYRLAAILELERAIENAPEVDRWAPLTPTHETSDPALCPTVDDLLVAIGADSFLGDAHRLLGDLYFRQANAQLAEEHFDAAVAAGVSVESGYRQLGQYYENVDRHLDAARAHAKDLHVSPGHGGAGLRMLMNLEQALRLW